MNKLFLITWRWLKKDKKRTALTFFSIVLSVYLICFVGVYMSTALSFARESTAFSEPQHAEIELENIEQAKKLDKNVAWESHCTRVTKYALLSDRFLESCRDSDEYVFPLIDINGISLFRGNDIDADIIDGDAQQLMGEAFFQLTGEMPSKANEVAISHTFAARFGGIDIGDSVTIKISKQTGTLYYAEFDEEEQDIKRDNNGEIIYKEDTNGEILNKIYNSIEDDLGYTVLRNIMLAENGGKPSEFVFSPSNDEYEDFTIPPSYAQLSGEPDTLFEYTATVTGFIDGGYSGSIGDIAFSSEDSEMLSLFDGGYVDYYVRVKPGADAEEAVINALKGIDLYEEDNPAYYLNTDLLILEGRQLEYIGNVGIFFALAAVVLGVFVFLARLIINNAFEISAAYRTEQYGALKTVGASNKQIFVMIMFECALYILTAAPIGFFTAVGVGKLIVKKIREIGVFDSLYGEGISERFLSLEFSPAVMLVTFGCALFSVFFSAYADAMRVRRMQPIKSVGYASQKKIRNKRSMWITRRYFGYSRGFAFKCISKQKTRFAVTLLAAVMSGILITVFSSTAKLFTDNRKSYTDKTYDMEIYNWGGDDEWEGEDDGYMTIEETANYVSMLKSTGMFEDITPHTFFYLFNGSENKQADQYLSEEYKKVHGIVHEYVQGLMIYAITREDYDKYIQADMSYDEFCTLDEPLLCNSVGGRYYIENDRYWLNMGIGVKESCSMGMEEYFDILDIQMYNTENIDHLEFTGFYFNEDGAEEFTEQVGVGGFYETNEPGFMNDNFSSVAIMPFDNFPTDKFQCQQQGYCKVENSGFSLNFKDGASTQARTLVRTIFAGKEIEDFTAQKDFKDRSLRSLRIAGLGFAFSLAAVTLLNIFSTMSANMINRRRDFSMLRSCGMSMKQVRKSMFAEARIYAVITAVFSTIAGWLLTIYAFQFIGIITYNIEMETISEALKLFPWQLCIVTFAVVMLTIAAAVYPTLASMKKQNIAQEIRTDI